MPIERFKGVVFAALCLVPGAAFAQSGETRPAGVKTVGPWEIVQWVRGRTVSRCTVIRDKRPAGVPSYGILTDRDGILLSVEANAWTLTPNSAVTVTLAPKGAAARQTTARPVSAQRANVDLGKGELLKVLQSEAPLDVTIGAVKVSLPFDDFNAARIVYESCVLNLGKELRVEQK